MEKMTYAQAIDFAVENIDNIDVIEKLQALKAQLAKRGSSKTPTKTQKENVVIMERIVDALSDVGEPVTVTDLLKHGVEGYELTNQKASALLRKMVEDGKVVKSTEGRKTKFSLA
jgi:hypothetical protein